VAPCVVYAWHVESRSTGFLVEPQNQDRQFVSGLASKPVATVSSGLASKPVATVFCQFGFKTGGDGFSQFGLKTGGGFLG
jgi:hypothetical protein